MILSVTTLMPSDITKGTGKNLSAMLFGNFADVIVGQWGGLDIIVDPYTLKKSAQVEITMNAWHDVFVRHDESFAAIKDIKNGIVCWVKINKPLKGYGVFWRRDRRIA